MSELAVFDSWGGHFSDNPRAISEALHRRGVPLRQCWVLADDAEGPAWADRVAPGSDEHLAALGEARYVVANNLLPRFAKRPGAVVLQTWHGTPLKRIGFDLPDDGTSEHAGYLAHLDHERTVWDLLLSPNPASTPRLRSAFRFDGRVLETGYPRNDALAAGDRILARHALGLPEDARVVLYAPTFRQAGSFDLRLDAGSLAEALGPQTHVLLRLHHFAASTPQAPHPRVHDVTRTPDDLRELLLAADALVTDYSSVMFDFALTGRPMVFFAYDLEEYRRDLNGFYFDLGRVAPGPIVDTTEGVAHALGAQTTQRRDRYEAFQRTFCALEDGGASDRVVDALVASPR